MIDRLFDFQEKLGIPNFSAFIKIGDKAGTLGNYHIFPIASVTKTFTARAIEQTAIDLDAPVRDILPDFRLHDPRATREITVRDLLSHRSGLPPHTWAWVFAPGSRMDFIHNQLPHLQHIGPHDQQYRYSNITYAIAGACIEAATGHSWEDYLSTTYFPRMPNTHHLDKNWHELEDLALPHRNGKPIPFFHARLGHPIAPASELMTDWVDLAHWLRTWLETPDSPCLQPQTPMSATRDYGLGWRLETINDVRHAWHTGGCSGYSACVSILPEHDACILLLANDHGHMSRLQWLCRRLYADHKLLPEPEPLPSFERTPPAREVEPPKLAQEISGTFTNPGYGTLDIQNGIIRWNNEDGGALRIDDGTVNWHLPQYRSVFAVEFSVSQLRAKLESRVEAIGFDRVG